MTAMWSSVLGPRGVELTGIADSTRGVVEASATRFGNLAERTQLCSTKSTEAFQVSPRSAATDSIITKHKTAKRTNLRNRNEIKDEPPRGRPGTGPTALWRNKAIKSFCGACRRENRLGRTR
jgi:hypothetical protein